MIGHFIPSVIGPTRPSESASKCLPASRSVLQTYRFAQSWSLRSLPVLVAPLWRFTITWLHHRPWWALQIVSLSRVSPLSFHYPGTGGSLDRVLVTL